MVSTLRFCGLDDQPARFYLNLELSARNESGALEPFAL